MLCTNLQVIQTANKLKKIKYINELKFWKHIHKYIIRRLYLIYILSSVIWHLAFGSAIFFFWVNDECPILALHPYFELGFFVFLFIGIGHLGWVLQLSIYQSKNSARLSLLAKTMGVEFGGMGKDMRVHFHPWCQSLLRLCSWRSLLR